MATKHNLPLLHALILDFASMNGLDSSGLQIIVAAQNVLNHNSNHRVEFHFVNILHPAIRRYLTVAHFDTQPQPTIDNKDNSEQQQEILSVALASKDEPQLVYNCNGYGTNNYQVEEKFSHTYRNETALSKCYFVIAHK